jgi:hypothetical protein
MLDVIECGARGDEIARVNQYRVNRFFQARQSADLVESFVVSDFRGVKSFGDGARLTGVGAAPEDFRRSGPYRFVARRRCVGKIPDERHPALGALLESFAIFGFAFWTEHLGRSLS